LRNELKRATEKAKMEYLEKASREFMEFHRTGRYDLMYLHEDKRTRLEGDPGDSKYCHR
jgi:hypothetical protein